MATPATDMGARTRGLKLGGVKRRGLGVGASEDPLLAVVCRGLNGRFEETKWGTKLKGLTRAADELC